MTALPSKLQYQTRIEGASARSYRSSISPQSGTGNYNGGDTIIINIPTRNNLVLVPSESYLKFTATINNGSSLNNYIRFDSGGAHGLFARVRVFSGSNLLSDIDNYNVLAKMMMDIQVSTDATYGKYSCMAGTRSDLTVAAVTGTTCSVLQTNSGYRFNNTSDALGAYSQIQVNNGIVGIVKQTFCINLMSLVGSLCAEKYFPLFAATSAPLRVELQLVSSASMALCTQVPLSTASFVISNCEYIAQLIELSDAAMSTILGQSAGGPLQFAVTDFKNFASSSNGQTNANTTTSLTVPIAAKYSSLKALYVTMRDASLIGASTYFPHSSNKFNLQEYFFRVGSQVVPTKNPNSAPEMFAELMKSIGSMGDINHQPSIDFLSYNQDYPQANNETATTPGTVQSGSFYVGLDLENYSGADRSTIFAGWNSNTDDIYFNPTFGVATDTVARTIRFDTFAMFDSVLVFENNTAYCKF